MQLRYVAALLALAVSTATFAEERKATQPNIAENTPPVPGRCTEPAAENVGKPGCFLTTELAIPSGPVSLYWHIYSIDSADAERAVSGANFWAVNSRAHGTPMRYLLGPREIGKQSGKRLAVIGPLHVRANMPLTARFIESTFPPGMRTRVHSHPGPEAFYVLDGVQCMDSPAKRKKVGAGETFIVPSGVIHVQSAPNGRRNIAVVLHQPNAEWMAVETAWQPSSYCNPR